jgi:hypothetical protein
VSLLGVDQDGFAVDGIIRESPGVSKADVGHGLRF